MTTVEGNVVLSGSPFSLEGRVALVTGARRGIGLAIAEAMARAGADIIGVSAALESDGGTPRQRVEALGRRFWGMTADLSRRDAVRELINRVRRLEHPVDILVNNAGAIHRAPAAVHSLEA
jgi:2-deoxy-D-gluconate 3-dehydrogenase